LKSSLRARVSPARFEPVGTAKPAPRGQPQSAFAADVIEGLTTFPKRLPPKYFYDEAGSELFERITELPEYYPTRTELGILEQNAPAIAALFDADSALIEFGSGSSRKARILLGGSPALTAYVPVDISPEMLNGEAAALRRDFPKVSVLPLAADFTRPFKLPPAIAGRNHAGFFPGSTIGNFEPSEASTFLRNAGRILGPGALFIVGVDLIKAPEILHAAYNDAAGVTAKFNLNLLARINHELGADFDLDAFEHRAFYNRERHRIEMHLASTKCQRVRVCGEAIDFRAGETIHTENSYKYSVQSFGALARGTGWNPVFVWMDPNHYFSVHALAFGSKAAG
jgi:dimethylhistidine N-methyltransferase